MRFSGAGEQGGEHVQGRESPAPPPEMTRDDETAPTNFSPSHFSFKDQGLFGFSGGGGGVFFLPIVILKS